MRKVQFNVEKMNVVLLICYIFVSIADTLVEVRELPALLT